MKKYLSHPLVRFAFLTLPALILLPFSIIAFEQFLESQRWVAHTHATIKSLDELFISLQEMESYERGYISTGDEIYLDPFNQAQLALKAKIAATSSLLRDNPLQVNNLQKLEEAVNARANVLRKGIDLRRNNDLTGALNVIRTGRGREVMNEIRMKMHLMITEEERLLDIRISRLRKKILWIAGLMGAFVLLVILILWQLLVGAVKETKTMLALQKAHDELELRVQERTADLTERTEELARSNEELAQFAHVASHDLQEPLRKIGIWAQLAAKKLPPGENEELSKYLRTIQSDATRLRDLIQDLLTFASLSKPEVAKKAVDTSAVVRQVLEDLAAPITEKKAEVVVDPLPVVKMNPSQVHQLFQNLIGNALKFHREHPPRIHIAAESRNGEIIFSVKDNGIGIEPKYIDEIFAVFRRLHSKAQYPGTGIGLAICKKIVEAEGGRIWVTSIYGEGSTFYFSLPRREETT